MRKLICIACLLIGLTACKDKNTDSVRFDPPVVKPDMEELQTADPGVKSQKGDPNADIPVDAPVGNADYNVSKNYNNGGPNANSSVTDTSKKIIKNGTIEFEADDLLATRKKILSSLKKYGGYVNEDNQSINSDSNRKEYELKIRIPAKYFDLLLDTVSSTADKIDTKNISITDVTTSFIDITTRLGNKKTLEKRYLELLSKATKISDLLEIENKLNEIRSDIESTQGQLNYMSKQVAYSSLDITFYTKQAAQINNGVGFGYKLKRATTRGWHRLQNLFFGLIGLWPYILLVGLGYWLIRRWFKRKKDKRVEANQ